MATSPYDEVLRLARSLPAIDQERLLAELNSPSGSAQSASIFELEGLGKKIWMGIDTDEYLDRERESWDR